MLRELIFSCRSREPTDDSSTDGSPVSDELAVRWDAIRPVLTAKIKSKGTANIAGSARAARNIAEHAHLGEGTDAIARALVSPQRAQRRGRRRRGGDNGPVGERPSGGCLRQDTLDHWLRQPCRLDLKIADSGDDEPRAAGVTARVLLSRAGVDAQRQFVGRWFQQGNIDAHSVEVAESDVYTRSTGSCDNEGINAAVAVKVSSQAARRRARKQKAVDDEAVLAQALKAANAERSRLNALHGHELERIGLVAAAGNGCPRGHAFAKARIGAAGEKCALCDSSLGNLPLLTCAQKRCGFVTCSGCLPKKCEFADGLDAHGDGGPVRKDAVLPAVKAETHDSVDQRRLQGVPTEPSDSDTRAHSLQGVRVCSGCLGSAGDGGSCLSSFSFSPRPGPVTEEVCQDGIRGPPLEARDVSGNLPPVDLDGDSALGFPAVGQAGDDKVQTTDEQSQHSVETMAGPKTKRSRARKTAAKR